MGQGARQGTRRKLTTTFPVFFSGGVEGTYARQIRSLPADGDLIALSERADPLWESEEDRGDANAIGSIGSADCEPGKVDHACLVLLTHQFQNIST